MSIEENKNLWCASGVKKIKSEVNNRNMNSDFIFFTTAVAQVSKKPSTS